ncbi:MAG: MerR family transcriptional regulator [Solirubrobacterales bacterium]
MNSKGFTIGEIAKAAKVNKETIRYYEAIGLITEYERGENKYRIFSEEDIRRIIFIKQMQMTGFKLIKIKEILDILEGKLPDRNSDDIKEIIDARIEEIDSNIQSLLKMKDVIITTIENNYKPKDENCFILDFIKNNKKIVNRT